MSWLRLLTAVGRAFDRHWALRLEYLIAENRVLRSKLPRRVRLTDAERRRFGRLGRDAAERRRRGQPADREPAVPRGRAGHLEEAWRIEREHRAASGCDNRTTQMAEARVSLYLDQNKWIDLARAYHGQPAGNRFQAALDAVESGIAGEWLSVPLTSGRIIELARHGNRARRSRLAQVFVHLSRGTTLAPVYSVIRSLARRAAQVLFVEDPPEPLPQVHGGGIEFAFGDVLKLDRAFGGDAEPADRLRRYLDSPEGLLDFLEQTYEDIRLAGTRSVTATAGRFADDVDSSRFRLRTDPFDVALKVYHARALIDLSGVIAEALARVDRKPADFLALGPAGAASFVRAIPPLRVEAFLGVTRDRHWDRRVAPNDSQDIGGLAVAIPYCDVVVSERFWADVAKRHRLDREYSTSVLRDTSEIPDVLARLAPTVPPR